MPSETRWKSIGTPHIPNYIRRTPIHNPHAVHPAIIAGRPLIILTCPVIIVGCPCLAIIVVHPLIILIYPAIIFIYPAIIGGRPLMILMRPARIFGRSPVILTHPEIVSFGECSVYVVWGVDIFDRSCVNDFCVRTGCLCGGEIYSISDA
jgi:hypothetical protein